MNAIWKFKLGIETTEIAMPVNARIISVDVQWDDIVVYAMVDADPQGSLEMRTFVVYATGQKFDYSSRKHKFIGTVQMSAGAVAPQMLLQFHVFEIVKALPL